MGSKNIGIIGCGNISDIYMHNCDHVFENIHIAACADLVYEKAASQAAKYGIPKACSVPELLADPDIDIVLNLTIPAAHAGICEAALDAGKSVYVEKPLAITFEDGTEILEKAKRKGLYLGCAPDTFLGGGIQTCRRIIAEGLIGQPVAANAFMLTHGPESWHPGPEIFYQTGAGPLFDMGPYYLTAMVYLMGGVMRVTASAHAAFSERTITSQARYGEKIKVEVPTHVAGLLKFHSGAIGNLVTSFDVWSSQLPYMEIYGTEGTLSLPDPNSYGGPVRLRRKDDDDWTEVPITCGFTENSRGLGLSDMADAMTEGRRPLASGALACHVLELMHGFYTSAEEGRHYDVACGYPPVK